MQEPFSKSLEPAVCDYYDKYVDNEAQILSLWLPEDFFWGELIFFWSYCWWSEV